MSDELGLFAHPRPAHIGGHRALLQAVPDLVAKEGVTEVVVGVPLTLSGGDSEQTRITRAFVERLRGSLNVPVSVWDEALTTAEAATHVPRARHRDGTLDSAAAALLLQAVLDARAATSA